MRRTTRRSSRSQVISRRRHDVFSAVMQAMESRVLLSYGDGGNGSSFADLVNGNNPFVAHELLVKVADIDDIDGVLDAADLPSNSAAPVIDHAMAVRPYRASHSGLGSLTDAQVFDLAYAAMSSQEKALYRMFVVTLPTQDDVLATARELSSYSDVVSAAPNYIATTLSTPNDPYFSSSGSMGQTGYGDLWALQDDKLDAEDAWDITKGSGVVVAVIDGGIDYNHADLAANIWQNTAELNGQTGVDDDNNGFIDDIRGWDFAAGDNNPMDTFGHGTHVAGTIAAVGDNNIGVVGVAPEAKVMAVRTFGDNSGSQTNIIQGLYYAIENGADVLNNSWGGIATGSFDDVFNFAYSQGVIVIAAAGNSNSDVAFSEPANLPHVISVAASTPSDTKAFFSNWGWGIDVAAPGGGDATLTHNILSTMPDGSALAQERPTLKVADGYWRLAGTSMAAPHVAGLAALILSEFPGLSPELVRARVRAGAEAIAQPTPAFAGMLGSGRINLYNSLAASARPVFDVTGVNWNNIRRGTQGTINVGLQNLWDDADNVSVTLTSSSGSVTIVDGSWTVGDLNFGQAPASNAADPFVISVASNATIGSAIPFELHITADGGVSATIPFSIDLSWFSPAPAEEVGPVRLDYPIAIRGFITDVDGQGTPEIFSLGSVLFGNTALGLYRRQETQGIGQFQSITSSAGLGGAMNPWAMALVDVDNDGDRDLFVGRAPAASQLFRNNGDGTFTDISAASGISGFSGVNGVAVLDYNNDGRADLITNGSNGGAGAFVLRNNANGTFTDVRAATGLPQAGGNADPTVLDYDNDGDSDLLYPGTSLYRNNGNGTFTDVTTAAGIPTNIGTVTHAAAADYDNDGDVDVFLATRAMLRNNGNGTFTDVTASSGITNLKSGYLFNGSAFADFDNDGDVDLFVADNDQAGTDRLYENNGSGTFTDVTSLGWQFPLDQTAGAVGDYDDDGAVDLYAPTSTFGSNGVGALLRNTVGLAKHYLKLQLRGTGTAVDAYGARVVITTGSLNQTRQLNWSNVDAQNLHFGVGTSTLIDQVQIYWPDGTTKTLTNVPADQTLFVQKTLVLPATMNEGSTQTLTSNVRSKRAIDPLTYTWVITKDGNPFLNSTTTSSIQFTPDDDGTYAVSVTVKNAQGNTITTESGTIVVNNVLPTITNLTVSPGTINEGGSVTVSGTISDPGLIDDLFLQITWGDGETTTAWKNPGTSSFQFSHAYADDRAGANDTYTIQVSVSDDDGSTFQNTSATVNNLAPDAWIKNPPTLGVAGTPITLKAGYLERGADAVAYSWTATRNGTTVATGSLRSFTFTPSVDGAYTVSLSVSDGDGGIGTDQAGIIINSAAPTVVSAVLNNGSPNRSRIGEFAATFSENVQIASGALKLYRYNTATSTWVSAGVSISAPSYNATTFKAVWDLSGIATDGWYTIVLPSPLVTDGSRPLNGNDSQTADHVYQFHRLSGDYDGNRVVNAHDIDLLFDNLGNGAPYDLDGDADADFADVDELVHDILGTEYGDANLDGRVDGDDEAILAAYGGPGGWAEGDFDGDDWITTNDQGQVWSHWGFENTGFALPSLPSQPAWDNRPRVRTVTINGGDAQRSRVQQLQLQFSEAVTVGSGPLSLYHYNPQTQVWSLVSVSATPSYSAGVLTWNLSELTQDGWFKLVLNSQSVQDGTGNRLDGDGDTVAGDDFVYKFFRQRGDFDGDGRVDHDDIELLVANYASPVPSNLSWLDLTGDGATNISDLDLLVTQVIGTYLGDANLDGRVNAVDLKFLHDHYSGTGTWIDGDFTGDGLIEFADLVRLAQNFNSTNATFARINWDPRNPPA
jgi:subtilisin family serine protease